MLPLPEDQVVIMPLTENELKLIAIARSLEPFEKLVISADKMGKPDTFLVEKSRKIILST